MYECSECRAITFFKLSVCAFCGSDSAFTQYDAYLD